jgi:hypothetical protein
MMNMDIKAPLFKILSGMLILTVMGSSSWPAWGATLELRGAPTADEAASPAGAVASGVSARGAGGRLFAESRPDTLSGRGFTPDDENENHLVRDIGVFLIVSVFVAYFLIKVFLEGETEDNPPASGGKVVPNPFTMHVTF